MRGASHRPVIVLLMAGVLVAGCGSSSPSITARPTPAPPSITVPITASPTPAPPSITMPTAGTTAHPSPPPQTYVVAKGDTFSKIARRFGVTVEELLAANPSINDPNRLAIGDALSIPPSSVGTLIRIEGPDYLHPRIEEQPTLVLIADPGLAGETVEWQIARQGGGWYPYNSDIIDASGRASMHAVDPALQEQRFRARVPASVAHPELWTQTVTVECQGLTDGRWSTRSGHRQHSGKGRFPTDHGHRCKGDFPLDRLKACGWQAPRGRLGWLAAVGATALAGIPLLSREWPCHHC